MYNQKIRPGLTEDDSWTSQTAEPSGCNMYDA